MCVYGCPCVRFSKCMSVSELLHKCISKGVHQCVCVGLECGGVYVHV